MDSDAFAAAAGRYSGTIYRIAFHSCKNQADAEDITQNVLLKLFRTQRSTCAAGLSGWR